MAPPMPARAAGRRRRPPPCDAAAWIAAGLDALAADGIAAVRVEPLAKTLGVTKGSFYWHFTGRRALVDAMIADWSRRRVQAIGEQTAGGADAARALRRLAALYTARSNARGLAIELAMRALARSDNSAAAAVAAVDAARLSHVASLFVRLGFEPRAAKARAVMLYSYLFGHSLLDAKAVTAADRASAFALLLAAPATSGRTTASRSQERKRSRPHR